MSAQAPESPDAAAGTFRPLGSSARQGHGPRALLLCGLPADARDAIAACLATLALDPPPPVIAVAAAQADLPLEQLAAGTAPHGANVIPSEDVGGNGSRDARPPFNRNSPQMEGERPASRELNVAPSGAALPSAIVFSGLREDELGAIMTACRQLTLPPVLWAMLTPTNAAWSARALITELAREREALRSAFAAATPTNTPGAP